MRPSADSMRWIRTVLGPATKVHCCSTSRVPSVSGLATRCNLPTIRPSASLMRNHESRVAHCVRPAPSSSAASAASVTWTREAMFSLRTSISCPGPTRMVTVLSVSPRMTPWSTFSFLRRMTSSSGASLCAGKPEQTENATSTRARRNGEMVAMLKLSTVGWRRLKSKHRASLTPSGHSACSARHSTCPRTHPRYPSAPAATSTTTNSGSS